MPSTSSTLGNFFLAKHQSKPLIFGYEIVKKNPRRLKILYVISKEESTNQKPGKTDHDWCPTTFVKENNTYLI